MSRTAMAASAMPASPHAGYRTLLLWVTAYKGHIFCIETRGPAADLQTSADKAQSESMRQLLTHAGATLRPKQP